MAEQKLPDKAQETEMKREKVRVVPIKYIDDSPDHPFQVRDDEEMMSLVESIATFGVITPVIARKTADERYELISGHRRKRACELLHIDTLPIIVRDLSREEGIILMVDSNLQREHILPSEKAFAYKMKMDAMKRQGQRNDLTCAPVEHKLNGAKSRDILGNEVGESREQVRRYIRLTNLVSELLELVDEGKIKMRPAVELSYLDEDCQRAIVDEIDMNQCTPSHDQSIRMRKMFEEGKLTPEAITAIMTEQKPNQRERFIIRGDRVRSLIPKSVPLDQTEEYIVKALKYYADFMRKRTERDSR